MQSHSRSLRFYATHCLCPTYRCLQCLRYAFHLFAIAGPTNATLCRCLDSHRHASAAQSSLRFAIAYPALPMRSSLCLPSPSLGAAVIASPLPFVAVHFRAFAMLFLASPCHRSSVRNSAVLRLRFAETIQAMPLLLLAAPNFAFAAHSVSVLCRSYANHFYAMPLRFSTMPCLCKSPRLQAVATLYRAFASRCPTLPLHSLAFRCRSAQCNALAMLYSLCRAFAFLLKAVPLLSRAN